MINVKADAFAVTSGATAILSWLDAVNTVVQIGAGVVAIISGVFAAWYYYKKNKREASSPSA